jgi:hypothetical protein
MTREIDISNVTDEDVPFILQRPWIAEEVIFQGYRLPRSYYDAVGKQAPSEPEPEFSAGGGTVEGVLDQQTQTSIAERNYGALTNTQLRGLLEARELSTSGTKAELVERLEEDDEANSEDEEDLEDEEDDEG